MNTISTFALVSAIVIMTPGPDTAITIRNTLLGGRTAGFATALGVSTGQLVWALATALGVVTILVTSEILFSLVKFLGAGYLVLLGLMALRDSFRPDKQRLRDTLQTNEPPPLHGLQAGISQRHEQSQDGCLFRKPVAAVRVSKRRRVRIRDLSRHHVFDHDVLVAIFLRICTVKGGARFFE
jgi:hypothetical protein